MANKYGLYTSVCRINFPKSLYTYISWTMKVARGHIGSNIRSDEISFLNL